MHPDIIAIRILSQPPPEGEWMAELWRKNWKEALPTKMQGTLAVFKNKIQTTTKGKNLSPSHKSITEAQSRARSHSDGFLFSEMKHEYFREWECPPPQSPRDCLASCPYSFLPPLLSGSQVRDLKSHMTPTTRELALLTVGIRGEIWWLFNVWKGQRWTDGAGLNLFTTFPTYGWSLLPSNEKVSWQWLQSLETLEMTIWIPQCPLDGGGI